MVWSPTHTNMIMKIAKEQFQFDVFVSHFVYVHIWDQIGKTKMEKHALRIDHMIRWNTGKQKSSLATGDRHCPAVSSSHFLSWSDKLLKTNSVCWKTHNLNWQWQICISWDDVNCRGDEHLADTTNGQFSQHGRGGIIFGGGDCNSLVCKMTWILHLLPEIQHIADFGPAIYGSDTWSLSDLSVFFCAV